jgi:beta-phosphoglucomutase
LSNQPAGFIFDFDGVVVDSIGAHLQAWSYAVRTLFNQELVQPSRLIGHSTVSIGIILAEEAGHPEQAPDLVSLKRAALESRQSRVDALPGARELFDKLSSSNIPWGIASNANRAFIEITLAELAMKAPLVCAVEDVRNPKPAPDVFLLCAQRLGISPAEHKRIIVFEDSVHGIQAVVKAGMFAVGVTTQHDVDQLTRAGAKVTCDNLSDAIRLNWMEAAPF